MGRRGEPLRSREGSLVAPWKDVAQLGLSFLLHKWVSTRDPTRLPLAPMARPNRPRPPQGWPREGVGARWPRSHTGYPQNGADGAEGEQLRAPLGSRCARISPARGRAAASGGRGAFPESPLAAPRSSPGLRGCLRARQKSELSGAEPQIRARGSGAKPSGSQPRFGCRVQQQAGKVRFRQRGFSIPLAYKHRNGLSRNSDNFVKHHRLTRSHREEQ